MPEQDWAALGDQVVPEGVGLPGSQLPCGWIGMKLTNWDWVGRPSGDGEVLGLNLHMEIVETEGYTGQTAVEGLFIGETGNPQMNIDADPYAEKVETLQYRMRLVNAIGLAVGVEITGQTWNQSLEQMLERPFLAQVRAREGKQGGVFTNVMNAREFDPAKIVIDADPTVQKPKGGGKPQMEKATTLGGSGAPTGRGRAVAAAPAAVPAAAAPAAGTPTKRLPGRGAK